MTFGEYLGSLSGITGNLIQHIQKISTSSGGGGEPVGAGETIYKTQYINAGSAVSGDIEGRLVSAGVDTVIVSAGIEQSILSADIEETESQG